jgi:hypothetical protein
MFILFGGLFSPPPQMAAGARWFCYIDPITYAFRAIIPQQFYAGGGEFDVGAGRQLLAGPTPPCGVPGVPPGVPCGGGVMPGGKVLLNGVLRFNVDRYEYVSTKFDVFVADQWINLGYLALFIVAFQLLALYGVHRVRHIVR